MNLKRDEINKINKVQLEVAKRDFENFVSALKKGFCDMCGKELAHFSERDPCLHWMMRPNGFDKKHFSLVYKHFNFQQINSYLRWLANSEVRSRNINDLVEDDKSKKIIETTIVYKNLEWSISCAKGDLAGHRNKRHGNKPHYHFQMKIDGKIFIKYSDFHPQFTQEDLWTIEVMQGKIKGIRYIDAFGAGMKEVLELSKPNDLLASMRTAPNEANSQFHLTTLIESNDGTPISGSEIARIIKESKRTKVPLAKTVKKIRNVKVATIIFPGEGVPKLSGRTKRKR